MKLIVAGALAIDTIMHYDGDFNTSILQDKLDRLSVTFPVREVGKGFGGTAGNIAYNLNIINQEFYLLGKLGYDGGEYLEFLQNANINTEMLIVEEELKTAQAYIVSDNSHNQIQSFFPGPHIPGAFMNIPKQAEWAFIHIAPSTHDEMLSLYSQATEQSKQVIFDPGQVAPLFTADQLKAIISSSLITIANDYEYSIMCKTMGCTFEQLIGMSKQLIVTGGQSGSVYYAGETKHEIPAITDVQVSDPTGAGDAYRAGVLWSALNGKSLLDGMRLGSVMAAYAIEQPGAQSHEPAPYEIKQRFQQIYNKGIEL